MTTMKTIRRYSELMRLHTAEERYDYLRLGSLIGESTFGFDRYLNQAFYTSPEWKRFRRDMIIRDNGCDMALSDREIPHGAILVLHHINPITLEDIEDRADCLFDPENVVCVSDRTHRAIHFGDVSLLVLNPVERRQFDTCPWKLSQRGGRRT